jgi:hypothetical protein
MKMDEEKIESAKDGNEPLKERAISFRVSEEEYQKIQDAAQMRGEKPNEWARKAALSESGNDVPMTGVDQLLYREIACLRYLVGNGFSLLASDKLTLEEWHRLVGDADEKSSEIARNLIARKRMKTSAKQSG